MTSTWPAVSLRPFITTALVILVAGTLSACSHPAGPIHGKELKSFAVDRFVEALKRETQITADAAGTRQLCGVSRESAVFPDTTDTVATVSAKDGLTYCHSVQNYFGQEFGPEVESIAIQLRRHDVSELCQLIGSNFGLASVSRFKVIRKLTAEEAADTSPGSPANYARYMFREHAMYATAEFEMRNASASECDRLETFMAETPDSRFYITTPALLNGKNETVWFQAVIMNGVAVLVYTNGDSVYAPDFFGLWVDELVNSRG